MLLPAKVPDVPETRSDVVAARLARKLGPLFGVPWPEGQFPATWVCDFASLTVAEISRGAPSPTKAQAAEVDQTQIPVGDWVLHDRAVVPRREGSGRPDPLPYELAAATLNRFGPNTKAALVLTGANALLTPVSTAIVEAWDVLRQHGDADGLPVAQRLSGWTALVLDAYRSQPALLLAAVTARGVQRLLRTDVALVADRVPSSARCELGAGPVSNSSTSPLDLDLVDRTAEAMLSDAERSTPWGRALTARITELWTTRMIGLGAPFGEVQWHLSERAAGQRRVEAFAPYEPLLGSFVDEVTRRGANGPEPTEPFDLARSSWPLPTIPSARQIARRPVLTRRTVALASCAMIRTAFSSGNPEPFDDLRSLAALEGLERLVEGSLDADDPVRMLVIIRALDMRLEILRQDLSRADAISSTTTALLRALHDVFKRSRRGTFDPADAAELAFSANVELLAVARLHDGSPLPGLPPAAELLDSVARVWGDALAAIGLDATSVLGGPPGRPVDFHLHNYATFLGRRPDLTDVRRAAALFERVVLPSRRHHHDVTGEFRPLLHSLQNATTATTRLADADRDAGRSASANAKYAQARDWIVEAMDSRHTTDLLDRSSADATDEACRFALLAMPALLSAVQHGCSPDPVGDRRRCDVLLAAAERFADRVAKVGGHYARAAEIDANRQRLTTI